MRSGDLRSFIDHRPTVYSEELGLVPGYCGERQKRTVQTNNNFGSKFGPTQRYSSTQGSTIS